ncbi:glycosyltransferase family 4 protein [Paraburkholderia humisilvae]|uniref:D-inositol-3-phosphate glycosyltransferase n=1 Tax=Paraburkholderia humisilvae TaxID=627669 RepID=A0A6J5F2I7_9BURK|nr:glycosyltransferase family 4 protein [Paraburkholderia humisilvae]CAB3773040.1 D-inositol-3-phosphate glycosyltransferase [Paraburkholderia humisilvae]
MNTSPAIVMVHQGTELYGSDRSFIAALCALRSNYPDATIDVVLPSPGELVEHVERYANRILYDEGGVLRRRKLISHPLKTLREMVSAWSRYKRMLPNYDICYVNTIVCVAAIAALHGRHGGAYVHVREIPSAAVTRVFRALLTFSHASLIYNSNATAATFGLPGQVIHNGVDAFRASAPIEPRGSRALRLAIIGRISPWKGQQFVLDTLRLLGRGLAVEVRIVGDVFRGNEELLVKLWETTYECVQHVSIKSFTVDPTPHYAWADFVLVPSILPEPFGRVAIESFAAGRPVIASATGGLTEIVTDGETGLLFEPNDPEDLLRSIERALAMTNGDYERMAVAARRRYVGSFTINSYMRAISETVRPFENTPQGSSGAVAERRETS